MISQRYLWASPVGRSQRHWGIHFAKLRDRLAEQLNNETTDEKVAAPTKVSQNIAYPAIAIHDRGGDMAKQDFTEAEGEASRNDVAAKLRVGRPELQADLAIEAVARYNPLKCCVVGSPATANLPSRRTINST